MASTHGHPYTPKPWLVKCQSLLPDVFRSAASALSDNGWTHTGAATSARAALLHLDGCLQFSNAANTQGQHSVAATLLRSCAEAMSIFELGLQKESLALPLIRRWEAGKLTAGNLRGFFEREVWTRYGTGLWSEPWTEFYAQLCRAIQPYAHYSQEIRQWQFHARSAPTETEEGVHWTASIGPDPTDLEKCDQVALLQTLLVWVLGRITIENRCDGKRDPLNASLADLQRAILKSGFLTEERGDWSVLLLPVFWSDSMESP